MSPVHDPVGPSADFEGHCTSWLVVGGVGVLAGGGHHFVMLKDLSALVSNLLYCFRFPSYIGFLCKENACIHAA